MLAAGAVAVGAAVVLTGNDSPDPAPAEDPLTTPDGTVRRFYEALRQGDCETADALRTSALRAEVEANTGGCAPIAEYVADHPDRVDEVMPQASVEVWHVDESVAVVYVTFSFDGARPDRIEDTYLVRQPDGVWTMATLAEVESRDPDNPYINADMIVFVEANADDAAREAIEALLDQHVGVQRFVHVDEAASAAEARKLFQDNQAMLDRMEEDPALVQSTYRVVLNAAGDQAATDALLAELQQMPGVQRVVLPSRMLASSVEPGF